MAAIECAPAAYGVDLRRFVVVCAPAVIALLIMVPGIFIGYVPARFTTVEPIGVGTTHGTSTDMELAAGINPIIHVSDGRLDDLCLVPRISVLPVVPTLLSLRFYSPASVSLGEISFVGSGTAAHGLDLPSATVGNGATKDGPTGPFSVATAGGGRVQFRDLATDAYTLDLNHGLSVRSLRLGLSLGHLDCAPMTGGAR